MFKVVAGLLNLQQTYVSGVQQLAIDRIFRHEQYSSTALVNDIAVIKLRTPAQINSATYPICLPNKNGSQDPKVGQSVQIAGWGYTNSATKQLAQQLQQATVQILDINGDLYGGPGCNAWIRRGYSMNNAQQICAMSRDTRTDSCQGDSGGPLIRNIGSQWFLYGIVSYGDSVCASSTAAGVYTRVSAYIPWIEQKLRL
jgi:secreted trypsin-like serine protease